MQSAALQGGSQDPPRDAAFAFRALMNAMARPGTIETLTGGAPPALLSEAAGTLLLTLTDPETPVYLGGALNCPEVRNWIAFQTGAPLSDPAQCVFAIGTWDDLLPLSAYSHGTPEYPDRSATLIVECDTLSGEGSTLTGPGIRSTTGLLLPDPEAFAQNHAMFPLGLDFYFTSGASVAALPRSTRIR